MNSDRINQKILFVSARLPFPALEGHQIRAYGLIKELSKFSELHLLTILRPGEDIDLTNELGDRCASISGVPLGSGMFDNVKAGIRSIQYSLPLVVCKYVSPELKKEFSRKIKEIAPDIIHLDLLTLFELRHLVPKGIKVVLDEHNVESDLILQKIDTLSRPLERLLYKREYRLLSKFEKSACLGSDVVLACSDQDRLTIEELGATNVWTIPNGVDTEMLIPGSDEFNSNDLVFLGGMGWYPNKLGIEWFISEVLPLITKHNPCVHLHLIGNPEPWVPVPEALRKYVTKHGFVDDFRPHVAGSGIMIVPLHVGSGTRLKVVEGASLGKCMVSTHKGAQGVMLTHGEEIVFADSALAFSEAVLELQKDKNELKRIGRNARKVAEEIYDWRAIGKNLKKIYQSKSAIEPVELKVKEH